MGRRIEAWRRQQTGFDPPRRDIVISIAFDVAIVLAVVVVIVINVFDWKGPDWLQSWFGPPGEGPKVFNWLLIFLGIALIVEPVTDTWRKGRKLWRKWRQ